METTWTPWDAATVEELRLIKLALLDIRALLEKQAAPSSVPTTNGHAPVSQLEIDATTIEAYGAGRNGSGTVARPRRIQQAHDGYGNYPEPGISLDNRPGRSAFWAVSHKRRKGEKPLRAQIHLRDWGEDAFRHAKTVVAIYRGQDVANNLERLPSEIRVKVNRQLHPPS